MKIVNQSYRKKDAMQLVTGQPVYTDDLVPNDCLLVKVLRSPHANAIIESINTAIAAKVPDIEAIYTWEDVEQDGERCTYAGQTYPEPSLMTVCCSTVMYALWVTLWRLLPAKRKRLSIRRCL